MSQPTSKGEPIQRDACQAMRDREHRRKLGPVNLEVGRKRSIVPNHWIQLLRSAIIFLIDAMAFPGLSPFGQVRVQLRIVWQRYRRNGSSRLSRRSPFASSRLSASQRQACRSTAGPKKRLPFHQWLGHPAVQQKQRMHAAGPLPSSPFSASASSGLCRCSRSGAGFQSGLDEGILRVKMV